MSTTRISVIPEAHLNSNKNDVIIMEDDEEDIYHESIIPNDLSISKSLKKLQIDVDSIKHTLKTVVKMLHNISVNKKQKDQTEFPIQDKQLKRPIEPETEVLEYVDVNEAEPVLNEGFFPIRSANVFRLAEEQISDDADFCEYFQMLLLELKDSENKEKALSKIVSEEVMKEFNWNGQNDKRAVNVNFLFTSIFNAWKTETFKWADWKKCIDSVCSRSNKRRKENDEKETEDEKETNNDEEPGSIDDDLAFQFPIVDFKEFDEMEARLSSDKPYEKEVMRYVKRLSQTLDHQDILEKLIADHVLEDLNLSGGDGKRSILNSKLFNFIYDQDRIFPINYETRDEMIKIEREIDDKTEITMENDLQQDHVDDFSEVVSDISKMLVTEEQILPVKDKTSFDKLITTMKTDINLLNKVREEFCGTKSVDEKIRSHVFRSYFNDDILSLYTWTGDKGKRAMRSENIFITLYDCWRSDTFEYSDFERFMRKEIDELRYRKTGDERTAYDPTSNNVGLFYDQRKKDDAEEEMIPTQPIEKSGNITDTQKCQLNSLKNTIEDIQKIFGNEYLDIETFPIKSTEDMDKLIAEVEEDQTTLNKLKAEFISSRSNCAKARKASFRRYFHNDLLVHYNWGGVCGKRSIEREKVFKTLFECWQSESFKYNQFKAFAKNELSLLRCRKAAMVSRKKAKERRETSS